MSVLLFPAHAGVIPIAAANDPASISVPRTRGGDPKIESLQQQINACSPHTRG